jgi:hypothetical protein
VCRPLPPSSRNSAWEQAVAPANGCSKAMEAGKMTVKQIGYVPVSIESRGLNGRRKKSIQTADRFSSLL